VVVVCGQCKSKLYGYSDGDMHQLYLCWACGKFYIIPEIEDAFNTMIDMNPHLILDFIKSGHLTKIV